MRLQIPQKESSTNELQVATPSFNPSNGNEKHVFLVRESLFTNIFDTLSGRFFLGLYFFLSCVYLTRKIALWVQDGHEWTVDRKFFISAFQGFEYALALWIAYLFVIIVLFYPITIRLRDKTMILISFTGTLVLGMLVTTVFVSKSLVQMGAATNTALATETMRMAFKMMFFVTAIYSQPIQTTFLNNNDKISDNKKEDLDEVTLCSLLYYIFAPTGIYRPNYPRAKSRNYPRIFKLLYIALTGLVFGFDIAKHTVVPLAETGLKRIPTKAMIHQLTFSATVTQIYFIFFLGVLGFHVWFNIWAEILRFGDRQFYTDYWKSLNNTFMLKWNKVMQDALFEVVYIPLKRLVGKTNAAVFVCALSGLAFHDWIVFMSLGVFLPVYTIMMPIAISLSHVQKETASTIWYSVLFHGNQGIHGILIGYIFVREYYAQFNCAIPEETTFISRYFVPRTLFCPV